MSSDVPTLYPGCVLGSFKLLQRVAPGRKSYEKKRWRVVCRCGTRITVPEMYLLRPNNPKTHCGCERKTDKTLFNEEYRIWLMMHKRTEDPTHVSYKHYGGRGIKVCAEWHRNNPNDGGFKAFLAYVGARPSPEYTIDRVDNNLGYQPFQADGQTRQVRWATAKEQRQNQRPRP